MPKAGRQVQDTDGGRYTLIHTRTLHVLIGVAIYLALILTALLVMVIISYGTNSSQNDKLRSQTHQLAVQNNRLRKLSSENRIALCALRHDLKNRVETSTTFLEKHPNGALGYSAAAIELQIEGQKRTIDALGSLNCPKNLG
jgi:hypothetical protein